MSAGPAAPAIEVLGLNKRYSNGTWANRDIDLEVAAGEVLAILGPNGAGKTTLVRQITTELTLFVVSFAPSIQVANIMTVLLGMVLAIISPVYFTMDQAPLVQRWLGFVSPLRYAADAIDTSLSGRSDVLVELAVLSAFAIAAMSLGLWKLPWRER